MALARLRVATARLRFMRSPTRSTTPPSTPPDRVYPMDRAVPDRRAVLGLALGAASALITGCSSTSDQGSSNRATTGAGSSRATGTTAQLHPSGNPTGSSATGAQLPGGAVSTTPTLIALGPGDITHGPRTTASVALTFHGAGDPALARAILTAAEAKGAHVSVLAVGSWLASNPSMAERLLSSHHELGNHTWSHLPMRTLGPAAALDEVARAAALLVTLTGNHGQWFRPSGTPASNSTIRAAALAAGYPQCLSYGLDSLDYTDPGPEAITRNVLGAVSAGSIVSLHLGHPGTLAAMPMLLSGLASKRLSAVTVSTLLTA